MLPVTKTIAAASNSFDFTVNIFSGPLLNHSDNYCRQPRHVALKRGLLGPSHYATADKMPVFALIIGDHVELRPSAVLD